MKFLGKLISVIFYGILPKSLHAPVRTRIAGIKAAFTSNLELRIFWKIVFFPIVLPISLAIACLKSVFLFISPAAYRYTKFIINQMYTDVAREGYSIKLTCKRAKLTLELFVKGRERKVSYGEKNPDKVFYVIRPYYYLTRNELTQNISNLMFHYYRTLQHLSYAIEAQMIPVIDWENYGPMAHGEDYPIHGTKNCWEYYWNQPSQYTLKEVYESKHVILSVRNTRDLPYMPTCSFRAPLQKQAEDYAQKCPKYNQYITLNEYTENYIREKQESIFPIGGRILGVGIRGTSYGLSNTHTAATGHPIQPSLGKLILSIHRTMEEWKMEYVFIACELQGVIDAIKSEFGDRCLFLPRARYERTPQRGDVEKGLDPLYIPGQKYQTNLDYVAEMELLSRCTALLAAMSSGVRYAIIVNNNKYENLKIFDNGLW